jgi:hypothetical protein
MLGGRATYLYGYRHLPARVKRRRDESSKLAAADWRIICALTVVMSLTILQSIASYRAYNVLPVWI